MLSVWAATRVLVAVEPVDLRGGFNRLYGLVSERLQADPLSGHLFVFANRQRTRVKVLYWDGSGLWLCTKRLEKGRFSWPLSSELSVSLRPEEWNALVHGMEVRAKADWYRR